MRTPWGETDDTVHYADGIVFVSTPSHGGFMVRRDVAERWLSPAARVIGAYHKGWYAYEEDCAYAVLASEIPMILSWDLGETVNGQRVGASDGTVRAHVRPIIERWYPHYFATVAAREPA